MVSKEGYWVCHCGNIEQGIFSNQSRLCSNCGKYIDIWYLQLPQDQTNLVPPPEVFNSIEWD